MALSRRITALLPVRSRGLSTRVSLVARSQQEMEQIGAQVAKNRRVGDVLFLKGNLGCGKTCFARGFIRALTQDAALQVTSPTYLLVNTYDLPDAPAPAPSSAIYHVDLYRLDSVSEQDKVALGLADAFANGISLVEWPERFDTASVPAERLDVHIEYGDDSNSSSNSNPDDSDGVSVRLVSFHPFGERWTAHGALSIK